MCDLGSDDETDVSSLMSNADAEEDDSRGDCMIKDIIAMILQFMEALGLHDSYKAFWNECDAFGYSLPPEGHSVLVTEGTAFGPRDANLLFKYFDFEEKELLLSQWAKFIAAIEAPQQQDFKKITFFVRIFAAIIPFRKKEDSETKSKSMGELRDFFQERSDEFSTDEKMLSLFALPFVADPAAHPVFKEIFQDSWKSKLRLQISLSIQKYCEFNNLPTVATTDLVQLYMTPSPPLTIRDEDYEDCDNNENKSSRCLSTQQDLINSGRQLKGHNHQHNNQDNPALLDIELRYHKLLKVTAEMVAALESTVQGEVQDMSMLRNRVTNVFPELFSAFQGSYEDHLSPNTVEMQQDEEQNQYEDEEEAIMTMASEDQFETDESDTESKPPRSRGDLSKRSLPHQPLQPESPTKNPGGAGGEESPRTSQGPESYNHPEEPEGEANAETPKSVPISQKTSQSSANEVDKINNNPDTPESTPTTGGNRQTKTREITKRTDSQDSQSSKIPTPPYGHKCTRGGEAFTVTTSIKTSPKIRSGMTGSGAKNNTTTIQPNRLSHNRGSPYSPVPPNISHVQHNMPTPKKWCITGSSPPTKDCNAGGNNQSGKQQPAGSRKTNKPLPLKPPGQ